MEAELVRPLPVQISPKSFELEADAVSIISSLESLPAPPEPFPLDQLLRATSATIEDDTFSDTDTVHYDYDDMTDVDVVGIQRSCADALTAILPASAHQSIPIEDQPLVSALSELLEATYELETFHPSCSISSPHTPPDQPAPSSPFLSLLQVLVQVQAAASKRLPNPLILPDAPPTPPSISATGSTADSRLSLTPSISRDLYPAVSAAREELAWSRVESLSQTVSQLVRERDNSTSTLAAHALPPKYRRSEGNSGGSDSLESLPSYKDHQKDSEVVEPSTTSLPSTSAPRRPMEKPITGAGDLKARMEEQAALEAAERRAATLGRKTKMGGILSDIDTVTHAIERLQSFNHMQDQRIPLRASSSKRQTLPHMPARDNDMDELNSIMDKLSRVQGNKDRLDGQRIDFSQRRLSKLPQQQQQQLAESSSSAQTHAKLGRRHLDGLSDGTASQGGAPDRESELSHIVPGPSPRRMSPTQDEKAGRKPTDTAKAHSPVEKKQNNRHHRLYDDGPLTPQHSRPITSRRRSDESMNGNTTSRSLSPVSMEFMFKELPMPPDHAPLSRRTSRDTMGVPRRSFSPSASDLERRSTVSSRSSSLARMPLREGEPFSVMPTHSPLSPTFSDIPYHTTSSPVISVSRGVPSRSTFDDRYLHRLSNDSKVSTWSKVTVESKAQSTRRSKPASLNKMPAILSSPRSPSAMSFGTPEEEDEDEDLFDFLTVGTGLGRMSNQDVELPRIRVPKADTSASGSLSAPVSAIAKSPGELLPAPRIVESVSDPEWMNRLQEESRPYYALSNASSLGIGESSRSAASMRSIRRNSFSSIMSSSSRTPLAPSAAPPATVSGGSGFKKLAASIKSSTMSRRSMKVKPPPLRTSGVLDVSSLTYVTEFQENIRSIQVLISGVDTTFLNTADLQLEVTGPTEAVLISKSDATPRFVISLPSPAHLGQTVNLQAIDDYLEARLSANSAKSKFGPLLHSSITHALSAPSLRVLAPRSICCTSCDRVVAHLPLDVEFKDLPSEYWAEMIEVWMCHADPSFTSQLAKHTSDGFWPTMETVLVGGSYLLVSGSHICDSNLILEKSNEWRIITCPCGEVLGKLRPEDGQPGAGTVRFSKWSIALLKGAGEISAVRFPVSTFVVSDMLELSQAHASHRFIICDERTGEFRLALWVFNPSIHVAFRRTDDSSHLLHPPKGSSAAGASTNGAGNALPPSLNLRAAKIMFKVLDPAVPTAYETLPGFGSTGQVEHLRYSHDVCRTLTDMLRASAALYPTPRRMMGSFEVGFLERV